jgi:hypothetical protein
VNPKTQRCVQCLQNTDCPYDLICDTTFDTCQACSSVDNEGCGAGQVCTRLGVSYNLAGYSGCVPNCLDAGEGLCNPGLCLFSGLCSEGSCIYDSDCTVDGGGVCNHVMGNACVACLPDGGGCVRPGDLCNTQIGAPFCQLNCITAPHSCLPGTFCTPSGLCAKGCKDDAGCSEPTPVCDLTYHACVECTTATDCPSYEPGCGPHDLCGTCQTDRDCNGQHCKGGICACQSDLECPNNAPTCIGLDGGISGLPRCGCLSSDECQAHFVCEARLPYNRAVSTIDGKSIGGICIPVCSEAGGTVCKTSSIAGENAPVADLVCEGVTGYCVQCRGDIDCSGSPEVPNCLRFGDGGTNDIEFGGQPTATGGGICGCAGTPFCWNNQVCGAVPDWDGPECQAACSVTGGPNACTSGGYAAQATPFCDTWTGLCRGCLADYSCTGNVSSWNGATTPSCELDSGTCVQCNGSTDCPANLPGCSSDPATFGACGFCATTGDCPPDAGYACMRLSLGDNVFVSQCALPCMPGDDAGQGTLSDASAPCPAALPYCISDSRLNGSVCSQCRPLARDCDAGYCFVTFCHP